TDLGVQCMRVKIMPYKMASAGAKALASLLSHKLGYKVFRVRPGYVPQEGELIINWGSSNRAAIAHVNRVLPVAMAINKKHCLTILGERGVRVPLFTIDKFTAQLWTAEGERVVCRTELQAHGGSGIVLATAPGDVV